MWFSNNCSLFLVEYHAYWWCIKRMKFSRRPQKVETSASTFSLLEKVWVTLCCLKVRGRCGRNVLVLVDLTGGCRMPRPVLILHLDIPLRRLLASRYFVLTANFCGSRFEAGNPFICILSAPYQRFRLLFCAGVWRSGYTICRYRRKCTGNRIVTAAAAVGNAAACYCGGMTAEKPPWKPFLSVFGLGGGKKGLGSGEDVGLLKIRGCLKKSRIYIWIYYTRVLGTKLFL